MTNNIFFKKNKFFALAVLGAALLCAATFAGCMDLMGDLGERSFSAGRVALSAEGQMSKVSAASSADPLVAVASVGANGQALITATGPGTTTVFVEGVDKDGRRTVQQYSVIVDESGQLTKMLSSTFVEDTATENPAANPTVKATGTPVSENPDIASVKKNDDGTIQITAAGPGTTRVTVPVTYTDENGNEQQGEYIYNVTVAPDGKVTSVLEQAPFVRFTKAVQPNPGKNPGVQSMGAPECNPAGIVEAIVDTGTTPHTLNVKASSPGTTTMRVPVTTIEGKTEWYEYKVTVGVDGSVTTELVSAPFVPQSATDIVSGQTRISTITGGITSGDEKVVKADLSDGKLRLTSVGEGTTDVTVAGTDSSGKYIMETYTVTVAPDGSMSAELKQTLTEHTESLEPNPFANPVLSTESVRVASCEPEGIAVVAIDDGTTPHTIKVSSRKAGVTRVTVKGTTSPGGEEVTYVYKITVAEDGSITKEVETATFTGQVAELNLKTSFPGSKIETIGNDPGDVESADESIATAERTDDGKLKVTSKKAGKTTVTVNGKDDQGTDVSETYDVVVTADGVTTVTLKSSFAHHTETLDVIGNNSSVVSSIAEPQVEGDSVTATLDTSSSPHKIKVTAKKPGTTKIKVPVNGGTEFYTYTVTVDEDGNITGLDQPTDAPFVPGISADKNFGTDFGLESVTSVSSSDEGIVTVTNTGNTVTATGVSEGETKITTKGKDNKNHGVTVETPVTVQSTGSVTYGTPTAKYDDLTESEVKLSPKENTTNGKVKFGSPTSTDDTLEYSIDGENWLPMTAEEIPADDTTLQPEQKIYVRRKAKDSPQIAASEKFPLTVTEATLGEKYKITFDMKDHGTSVEPIYVNAGDTATAPTAPTATGYTFGGWYAASDLSGSEFDWAGAVNANITLYAKWTVNSYTISYNLDGGSHGTSHPETATYGQNITISNPTKSGYSFKGWTITGTDGYSGSTTNVTATSFTNLCSTSGTVTFTANWQEYYSLNITQPEHGTIKANGKTGVVPVAPGTTVTLTCTPDDWYKLSNITAIGASDISGSGLTRTFIMPSTGVSVGATVELAYSSTPKAVGDVAYWDGTNAKFLAYTDLPYVTIPSAYKPVAVIFDVENKKGVGLKESTDLAWCLPTANGNSKVDGLSSTDGSGNYAVMKNKCSDFDENGYCNATGYPAWAYAHDYGNTNFSSGSTLAAADAWYLPAIRELEAICTNTAVSAAFDKINAKHGSGTATKLKDEYWSSTNADLNGTQAASFNASTGIGYNYDKAHEKKVRTVHKF